MKKKMIRIGDSLARKKLTPEFFSWLEETGKKYEKVIKELARR